MHALQIAWWHCQKPVYNCRSPFQCEGLPWHAWCGKLVHHPTMLYLPLLTCECSWIGHPLCQQSPNPVSIIGFTLRMESIKAYTINFDVMIASCINCYWEKNILIPYHWFDILVNELIPSNKIGLNSTTWNGLINTSVDCLLFSCGKKWRCVGLIISDKSIRCTFGIIIFAQLRHQHNPLYRLHAFHQLPQLQPLYLQQQVRPRELFFVIYHHTCIPSIFCSWHK